MLLAGAGGDGVDDPDDGMPRPVRRRARRARPACTCTGRCPTRCCAARSTERADGSANRLGLPRAARPLGRAAASLLPARRRRARASPAGCSRPTAPSPCRSPQWTRGRRGIDGRDAGRRGARRATSSPARSAARSCWAGVYDAVLNRFAFHDPLADVATVAPKGVDGDCAAYVVAGWWSDPAHDPLDAARSNDSLHELLERLRWRLLYDWGDEQRRSRAGARREFELRKALGLTTERALVEPAPAEHRAGAARRARRGERRRRSSPMDKTFVARQTRVAALGVRRPTRRALRRAAVAPALVAAARRGLRRAGRRRRCRVDRRPAPQRAARRPRPARRRRARRASPSAPGARPTQRRDTERLLAAFTAQKINRIGSPDGVGRDRGARARRGLRLAARRARPAPTASCSACRPAAPAASASAASAAERSAVRRAPLGEPAAPAPARRGRRRARACGRDDCRVSNGKPTAGRGHRADGPRHRALARRRRPAPTEARVVDRPAPRFTFPDRPDGRRARRRPQPAPRRRRPRLGRRQAHLPLAART